MGPRSTAAAALGAFLLLAACQDHLAMVPPAPPPPATSPPLAELRCRGDALAQTLACEPAIAGGASRDLLVVGGQHHYVRLSSARTIHDAEADTLSTGVTVQNLLLVPLGTDDGSVPHADGVRVFFISGPTDGVTVGNPTGEATFTAAGQPFFEYSGAALGGNLILTPDETSSSLPWRFAMNGATSFTFTVAVQAAKPAGEDYAVHFVQAAAGGDYSCATDANGMAYCWGSDVDGKLGNGVAPSTERGVPSPVQMPTGVAFNGLSTGASHTCAIGSDDHAYCWGRDADGQLGNGPDTNLSQPSPTQVAAPEGVAFTRISAGTEEGGASMHAGFTCALASDGSIYCWGDDFSGRLGDGPTESDHPHSPVQVVMPSGITFTSITAGGLHACALTSEGDAYCWGDDIEGQLGNGVPGGQSAPVPIAMPAGVDFASVSAGGFHTCALTPEGAGYCWGSDSYGQLGNGAVTGDIHSPSPVEMPDGVTFTRISTGERHTCAIGSDGSAYCWGLDATGQLGNNTVSNITRPTRVVMPAGATPTDIVAGSDHTCALTSGPAYCWGRNHAREIGDGSGIQRPVPVRVAASR